QARVDHLTSDLRGLESQIDNYASDLRGFNTLKLNLALAKQESEQMTQAYVGSQLKRLTAQNSITNLSLIEIPTWSQRPSNISLRLATATTAFLLLFGSVALVLVCLALDTSVSDELTVEHKIGIPLAGTLPAARRRRNEKYFAEAFSDENQLEYAM